MIVTYGDLPVPWTVMWSEEEDYHIADCPWFKGPAICQNDAQGNGVPRFGRPHTLRHRKAIALGLCDLCALPLRDATKVSLADPFRFPGIDGAVWLEPLLHRECAIVSLDHCPELQKKLKSDRLNIWQVLRWRPRAIPATDEDRERYVPGCIIANLIGLAVIELGDYRRRDLTWLRMN